MLPDLTQLLTELDRMVVPGGRIAAIGTRRLSDSGTALCGQVGAWAAKRELVVVSGAAEGSDLAFMTGARNAGGRVVAVLPWASYNAGLLPAGVERIVFDPERHPGWIMLAAAHHPAWDARRADGRPVLSRGMRALHARNTGILLGESPEDRVGLVVAHQAPNRRGGTEQGLRLATALGIPTRSISTPG